MPNNHSGPHEGEGWSDTFRHEKSFNHPQASFEQTKMSVYFHNQLGQSLFSMVSKPFVFEVFIVKSAQKVSL